MKLEHATAWVFGFLKTKTLRGARLAVEFYKIAEEGMRRKAENPAENIQAEHYGVN